MNELFQQFSDHLRPIIQSEVENAFNKYSARIQEPTKETVFYTRKQVCQKLSISLPTLHNHINNGKITAQKVGSRVLFRSEDVENCLNQINVGL